MKKLVLLTLVAIFATPVVFADEQALAAIPNPLQNAKVGDYAKYRLNVSMMGQNFGNSVMKVKVVALTETEATVLTTIELMGKKQTQKNTVPRTGTLLDNLKLGLMQGKMAGQNVNIDISKIDSADEKISHAGKDYDCKKVEIHANIAQEMMGNQIQAKTIAIQWFSETVPVNGIVRMEMNTKVDMQGQQMEQKVTFELDSCGNEGESGEAVPTPKVTGEGFQCSFCGKVSSEKKFCCGQQMELKK